MNTRNFGKKEFQLLAKLVLRKEAELAEELFNTYLRGQPKETDLNKIEKYYICFCVQKELDPENFRSGKWKYKNSYERKVFVCTMLHLYNPQVLKSRRSEMIVMRGLPGSISRVLNQDVGNISKMIREVILMYKVYEEFCTEVNDFLASCV